MKKRAGIWIDTKNAVLVFLYGNNHTIKTIYSNIESRERIPGETKWFTRFSNQFLNFEKRKKNRRGNEIREYLKKLLAEIKNADELVLFGPAGMKTELEKAIRKDTTHSPVIRAVETADSMTENQMVARVKNYYHNKNLSLINSLKIHSMFYEELYPELGKLFYYIAATDGKVSLSEKESLLQLIQNNWKPLEGSTDKYGTDQANLIDFAFEYEEAEGEGENGFQSFEAFYKENKSKFSPAIISNILQTGKAIASAYRGKSKEEMKVIHCLINLFDS